MNNTRHAFAGAIPNAMPSALMEPVVVPCYTDWYVTVIRANGPVLPGTQPTAPLGRVTKDRRFSGVWPSQKYVEPHPARGLPTPNNLLVTCKRDNCAFRPRNIAGHNLTHPLSKIPAGYEVQKFTPGDFARKMRGQLGHAPE